MWVLIALLSNESSGKLVQMSRLARGIAAPVHNFKVWMKMKTQIKSKSKKEGKDQESIQSSTTPDPGYQWENDNVTIRHHK